MSDPVSWFMIERGWKVVDADGEEIGHVEETLGDGDIFSGLVISHSLLGSPRYVLADDVVEIMDSRIQLRLRGDQVKQLEKYQAPEPG